jgi:hypothetical protein
MSYDPVYYSPWFVARLQERANRPDRIRAIKKFARVVPGFLYKDGKLLDDPRTKQSLEHITKE